MIELVVRIGFSLLVVFGLMWLLARAVRRPLGGRGNGALAVLTRQQLTRGAAVHVVRVGERAMVLGVTDQQVNLLGEMELAEFEGPREERVPVVPVSPAAPGALDGSLLSPRTWITTVDFLRDRTSRR